MLGPPAVWDDRGEPVAIPGRKVRALPADLRIDEGRPVPAERLVEDLWGDLVVSQAPGCASHDDAGVEPLYVGRLEVGGVEARALEQVSARADDDREATPITGSPASALTGTHL